MPSPSCADHFTFSVVENLAGNFILEVETPLEFGPRHCGQSSAQATWAGPTGASTNPIAVIASKAPDRHAVV
jgi:hypothetical protein